MMQWPSRKEVEAALKNPNVQKMLGLVSHTEGTEQNGYYTDYGGGRLKSIDTHPNIRHNFKDKNGKWDYTTAAGKYQFLNSTWNEGSKVYGIKTFKEPDQDFMAVAAMGRRGALQDIMAGNFTSGIQKLGPEWASLPSSTAPQAKQSWNTVNKYLGRADTPAPTPTPSEQTMPPPEQPIQFPQISVPQLPSVPAPPKGSPFADLFSKFGSGTKIPVIQDGNNIIAPGSHSEAALMSSIPKAGLGPEQETQWAKAAGAISEAQEIMSRQHSFLPESQPGPFDDILTKMIREA